MRNLLLIMLFTATIAVQGQETDLKKKNKFNYGILAGFDVYDFDLPQVFAYPNISNNISENTWGHISGFLEMDISKKFELRTELTYAIGSNSDYLEIPLMLRYKLCDKVYFYSGVQVNFLLDEKHPNYNRVGTGFHFGIEYNFAEHWFLDLRYVYKDALNFVDKDFHSRVRSIRLGLGYRF